MAIGIYDTGDAIRFSAEFTISGSYADPTEVTLKIRNPDDSVNTYTYGAAEITKTSVGKYYKDISMTQVGQLWYRFEGTGAVVSAEEAYLLINPSEFD